MANLSTAAFDETPEDLFHNYHLDLQEHMQNPIAFHAEMMGDIINNDQALQQPDVKQFANAVVKEVNRHVNNKLHPRTKHINICYHHFCKYVQKGLVHAKLLPTKLTHVC